MHWFGGQVVRPPEGVRIGQCVSPIRDNQTQERKKKKNYGNNFSSGLLKVFFFVFKDVVFYFTFFLSISLIKTLFFSEKSLYPQRQRFSCVLFKFPQSLPSTSRGFAIELRLYLFLLFSLTRKKRNLAHHLTLIVIIFNQSLALKLLFLVSFRQSALT